MGQLESSRKMRCRVSCARGAGRGGAVGVEGGGSPSYAHAGEAAHQVRHKNFLVLMSEGVDDPPSVGHLLVGAPLLGRRGEVQGKRTFLPPGPRHNASHNTPHNTTDRIPHTHTPLPPPLPPGVAC